jgi:peptidyl-prolyl cis-trans isomerase B (cyclophilin B)
MPIVNSRGRRPAAWPIFLVALALAGTSGCQRDEPAPSAPPPPAAPAVATDPADPKAAAREVGPITARIETTRGTIVASLEPNRCPILTANFCFLARRGHWNGRPWEGISRVVRQCGPFEPTYALPREFVPGLYFDRGGMLSMTKTTSDYDAKANGTRFFLTVKEQDRWNLDYPIFGTVTAGLDVAIALAPGDAVKSVTVEGDVERLLGLFPARIADWEAHLTGARKWTPGATPPRTPDMAGP